MKRKRLSRIVRGMQRVHIIGVVVLLSLLAFAHLKSYSNSQNGFNLSLLVFSFIFVGHLASRLLMRGSLADTRRRLLRAALAKCDDSSSRSPVHDSIRHLFFR